MPTPTRHLRRPRRAYVLAAAVAAGLASAVVVAQQPVAPEPNAPDPAAAVRRVDGIMGVDTPNGASDAPRTRPVRRPGDEIVITQEEWTALEQFMHVHSPSKWQMYQSLPDKPLKQNLRKQIAQRYRSLQRVEKSDPVRWKLEIDAIAIEDRIYSALQELRTGNSPDEQERHLRMEVDRLIANRDLWRRERLLRVKSELETMKLPLALKPVEEELDRLDKLTAEGRAPRVDKRLEEFKKQVDRSPKAILGGFTPASGVPAEQPAP